MKNKNIKLQWNDFNQWKNKLQYAKLSFNKNCNF